MRVETTSNMRLLDRDHQPPTDSVVIYTQGDSGLLAISEIAGNFYVTATSSAWKWPALWDALVQGDNFTLLVLMEK